ncbi:hypothetical protein NC651_002443 [Populus alba x Populus x berolinensis]|nr:hypothetical protein NC651_002443 [Populus alba x Populus x berolinensis]
MNSNHFLYFQIVPILCSCILCDIVSGSGNSQRTQKYSSPPSYSTSIGEEEASNEKEYEKKEDAQEEVEDSKKKVEMDVEPSRINKGNNAIIDSTVIIYVFARKVERVLILVHLL